MSSTPPQNLSLLYAPRKYALAAGEDKYAPIKNPLIALKEIAERGTTRCDLEREGVRRRGEMRERFR
jgi:hypothetical protein